MFLQLAAAHTESPPPRQKPRTATLPFDRGCSLSHCAAAPSAMFRNLHDVFRENLRRFLADQPLRFEVRSDRGY